MTTEHLIRRTVLILFFILLLAESALAAGPPDHSVWSDLLATHVREGKVDYQGFKKDENRLDRYLETVDASRPRELGRSDRLAYYINAYNAWTVKLILLHFKEGKPVDSIKDIGGVFSSPWSQKICRLGGEVLTLDEIEHGIIRPEFKEPRIHFAVNCASKSCPPLRDSAYTGEKLEQQLDSQTTAFINNPTFNHLTGDTFHVSKLFSWFEKDFEGDILQFIIRYASEDLKKSLEKKGAGIRVKYLEYDWSLNSI